jgi:hypothetical protein
MDRLLDNYRSSRAYLRVPNIAQCVIDAIQRGGSYTLRRHAHHVHLSITTQTAFRS